MAEVVRLLEFGDILLTRDTGRLVVSRLPKEDKLLLDCTGVQAITPSFLDEVVRLSSVRNTKVEFINFPHRLRSTISVIMRKHYGEA